MTVYDISHLEKTALAMTKKNWSDQASQEFDDAFRPAVAFQLVRDLQAARRNERHNGEAWGKAEARLADAARNADLRLNHLRRLHEWFLKCAPEHYEGCGLYIDVAAALSAGAVIPTPAETGGDVSQEPKPDRMERSEPSPFPNPTANSGES